MTQNSFLEKDFGKFNCKKTKNVNLHKMSCMPGMYERSGGMEKTNEYLGHLDWCYPANTFSCKFIA